jgi:uncharacterized protein
MFRHSLERIAIFIFERRQAVRVFGKSKRITGLLAVVAVLFSTIAFARAEHAGEEPRIQVSGVGTVQLAPDLAVLQLTVRREAETARAALDANSTAMKNVLAAMQAEGIEGRDLQTANFSIQPRYVYPPNQPNMARKPPRIVAYTVRNELSVRVRDIDRVGAILDKSVELGVNEGGNIQFSNADPSDALAQARTRAVEQALVKAKTLAKAAGVELGRVLEISEQSFAPRPAPMARAEMSMAADSAVPIASGQNSYEVTVQLSVAIDQ